VRRARYLVFFELCFVGVLCLATFLFALFAMNGSDEGAGWLAVLLAWGQIALAFVTLLITHLTLRTVFRRGSRYEASAIASSAAFRSVPLVVIALGAFHLLLLEAGPSGIRSFGWDFTIDRLSYIFAVALGWHVVTAWLLSRAPPEPDEPEAAAPSA
jgi:hypothetical protein